MKNLLLILALLLTVLTACQSPKKQEPAILSIESPAQSGSEEPNLFADGKGNIYLSWIEKSDKNAKLLFSKLENEKWTNPSMISQGDNWFVNWADFPRFMANGDLLAAHWLQKRTNDTYDYDIQMALSNDAGKTWNEPFIPHTDGVSAEHGFVSMLPMKNDQIFAAWLDGRFTKSGEGHSENGHGSGGAMTVRAAIFDSQGQTQNEWELDHRVCDCCQTASAMTSNGPIVVYRNRTEDEIRDMAIVRLVDNEWTGPQIIHNDNWNIAGCPVNGPSVVAKNDLVAVVWFSAAGGTPTVKLAISRDAGASFGEPTIVAEGSNNGRVGISMLPDESFAVSWMQTTEDASEVMVAHYSNSGELLNTLNVAKTIAARSSGFPVITSNGDDIYMAWTEVGEAKQVKTAKINF